MYDSIIALGIGASHAQNQTYWKRQRPKLQVPGNLLKRTESEIFNELVKVEFDGASGRVKLDDGFSYTPDLSTVAFGSYDFRPRYDAIAVTGEPRYVSKYC
jgi:hypothetical protein